jgi:hypothetical protein
VPVEEQQAIASAASEREHDSEEDAAVATEHDREQAVVENRSDGVGKTWRVVVQTAHVEDAGLGIDRRIERGRGEPVTPPDTEPLGEARCEQSVG